MLAFVCDPLPRLRAHVCTTVLELAKLAIVACRSIYTQVQAAQAVLNLLGWRGCPTSHLHRAFRPDTCVVRVCNIWLVGIRYFAGHDSLESCVQIVSDVSPALDREIKLRMVCAWNARFANLCAALVAIRHSMSMQDKNLQLWWLCKAWAVARG